MISVLTKKHWSCHFQHFLMLGCGLHVHVKHNMFFFEAPTFCCLLMEARARKKKAPGPGLGKVCRIIISSILVGRENDYPEVFSWFAKIAKLDRELARSGPASGQRSDLSGAWLPRRKEPRVLFLPWFT